jgi:predicted esterase
MLRSRIAAIGVVLSLIALGRAPAYGQQPGYVQPQASAQPRVGFVDQIYRDSAGEHRYVVFVPHNYNPAQRYPAILFLHGAGECGNDGRLQTTVGLGPFVKQREANFPFIAVFPQCESTEGRILHRWDLNQPDGKRALAILDQVKRSYSVDANRQILTGWSMGAYGAWTMAAAEPKHWSAVLMVSGGGDPALAPKVDHLPFWLIHGKHDSVVPVERSQQLVSALKDAGDPPLYTEAPYAGHDVWRLAFGSDEVYRWMWNPQSVKSSTLPSQNSVELPAPPAMPGIPFVPAVHVPRAVYVRLGNDALKAVSDAIPQMVPPSMMTGALPDISDSTSAQGHSFAVQMSNITYSGQLARANVQAYGPERLSIQFAMQNVQLTIGSTYIQGSGLKRASAGPSAIQFGFRYPIWLNIEVTPYLDQGRIRFRHIGTQFSIPADNWAVSGPSGISTRGLGMTAGRVGSGIADGLQGSRGRVEQQVGSIVPGLLRQLEERMDLGKAEHLLSGVWPLPVAQPRTRLWAQEISTDTNGVTILFGVTAAALTPQSAPRQPVWAPPGGPDVQALPKSRALEIGIAPSLFGPMSQTVVAANLARVNVLDTPVEKLKEFSDPKVLADAIPELKRLGDDVQVSTELVLTQPLRVSTEAGASKPDLDFNVPGLALRIAIKTDPGAPKWTPFAELDFSLKQETSPHIEPAAGARLFVLSWGNVENVEAKGNFAKGYDAQDTKLDVDKLKDMFIAGWNDWIRTGPASQSYIPDVAFAQSKLRIRSLSTEHNFLAADFAPAGVQLTNSTSAPIQYETKGPYSGWSQPFTIKPGETQAFKISFPLELRQQTPQGLSLNTLPAGSHSEFLSIKGAPPKLYQAREKASK